MYKSTLLKYNKRRFYTANNDPENVQITIQWIFFKQKNITHSENVLQMFLKPHKKYFSIDIL